MPVVVDADHPYYNLQLEAEPVAAALEPRKVDFLEVAGLELAQAQAWLSPLLPAATDVTQLYERLGGHPGHLRAVVEATGPGGVASALEAFLAQHAVAFAQRMEAW